jgi:hypothetical protein
MSVPTDFLSRFCQSAPVQKPFTKQDVIDDFCAYIQKCASESKTSNVYIEYIMPDRFKMTFTNYEFFSVIRDVLLNQMKCTLHNSPVMFWFQMEQLNSKSFYFVKTKISYQYNEKYKHNEFCNLEQNPDGVVLKLYYPKN